MDRWVDRLRDGGRDGKLKSVGQTERGTGENAE